MSQNQWLNDAGQVELTGTLQGQVSATAATAATQVPLLNQVSPEFTITSGALPTISPSSGTGLQVSTTRDADLYVTLTADATNNAATCTIALSPDNSTYSTIHSISLAAAVNNTGAISLPATIRVPASWYVKFTLSRFTIGNATYA